MSDFIVMGCTAVCFTAALFYLKACQKLKRSGDGV